MFTLGVLRKSQPSDPQPAMPPMERIQPLSRALMRPKQVKSMRLNAQHSAGREEPSNGCQE